MADVITVNGSISPSELGVTMSHTHLLSELSVSERHIQSSSELTEESDMTDYDRLLLDKPVTMDILGTIRRHVMSVKDNTILGDVNLAIEELMFYKKMGGTSVVETTLVGLKRDPIGLRKISSATGVNVISASGWYIAGSHPAFVKEGDIDELCDYMVNELTVGISDTGIRTGIIKAAMSGSTPDIPFSGDEEKVLRAAARAQAKTGAAMTVHPCHHYGRARHWQTYLNIMQNEGANLEKCYLSHMEFYCTDLDYQKTLLERGVTVSYDQFGGEQYVRPGWPKPSDQMRVNGVRQLVKAGYTKQIVLSNEIVYKCNLRKYGGYGYAHVLENIALDLIYYGVTEQQLNTMLIENPKQLLPF